MKPGISPQVTDYITLQWLYLLVPGPQWTSRAADEVKYWSEIEDKTERKMNAIMISDSLQVSWLYTMLKAWWEIQ